MGTRVIEIQAGDGGCQAYALFCPVPSKREGGAVADMRQFEQYCVEFEVDHWCSNILCVCACCPNINARPEPNLLFLFGRLRVKRSAACDVEHWLGAGGSVVLFGPS